MTDAVVFHVFVMIPRFIVDILAQHTQTVNKIAEILWIFVDLHCIFHLNDINLSMSGGSHGSHFSHRTQLYPCDS